MVDIVLSALRAKANEDGDGFSVIFDLTSKPPVFPTRIVTVKNTAEAFTALSEYMKDAGALGEPLVCTIKIREGRAPSGFNAANKQYYHRVNV